MAAVSLTFFFRVEEVGGDGSDAASFCRLLRRGGEACTGSGEFSGLREAPASLRLREASGDRVVDTTGGGSSNDSTTAACLAAERVTLDDMRKWSAKVDPCVDRGLNSQGQVDQGHKDRS